MADHFTHPTTGEHSVTTDAAQRIAALHQLCDQDYASAAARRTQNHRDDAHLIAYTAPPTVKEPSELAAAITVAQRMLAAFGNVGTRDIGDYAQAHGALTESLRILLRALGAEATDHFGGTDEGINEQRCPAAHHDDPTPCSGPAVVTVLDAHNTGANGCEHHGARILASLTGGRVYALPDAPAGSAIRVFKAAGTLRPFCWYEDGKR